MSFTTEWKSGWTAASPVQFDYLLSRDDGSAWGPRLRDDVDARDLGLREVSGGALTAQYLRSRGRPYVSDWHGHDFDFEFFLVLEGSVTVEGEDGTRAVLGPGGVGYESRLWRHRDTISPDYEALEISSPAGATTVSADDGDRNVAPTGKLAAAFHENEEASQWVLGAGPRRYFEYRNFDTDDPTEGRIHIHLLRAAGAPPPGGTGWHYHTMSQIFVVLEGTTDISVEGRGRSRMTAGDAMCIAAGMRHNVERYSADYRILEMCIPADYDTIGTDPPDRP